MWNRTPIAGVLLATAVLAGSVAGTRLATRLRPAAISAAPESPVEGFNRRIQERFHTLTAFGIARMPVVPQHVYEFSPETPAEEAAVAELRRQGWSMGLYLGGRGLLEPPMDEARWEEVGEHTTRRAISKPLRISGETPPAGLPKPWELQEVGQRALAASATADRYKTSFGRWAVEARPIRANQEACLDCHSWRGARSYPAAGPGQEPDLKIGDALGVAIYVYARDPGR